MAVYVIEVVEHSRVVRVRHRSADYDQADEAFTAARREDCEEVRFVKTEGDKRVVLKFATTKKAKRKSAYAY